MPFSLETASALPKAYLFDQAVLKCLLERLLVQFLADEHHLAHPLLSIVPLAVRHTLEDGVDTLKQPRGKKTEKRSIHQKYTIEPCADRFPF